MDSWRRPVAFIAAFTLLGSAVAIGALAAPDVGVWERPGILAAFVIVAAALCLVFAIAVIVRAMRNGVAELAWVGSYYAVISIAGLVHGVTTPGVVHGPNPAHEASLLWGIVLAACAAIPSLLPRHGAISVEWRSWVGWWLGVATVGGVALAASPELVPGPAAGSVSAAALILVGAAAACALALRHVRLAQIASSAGPLAIAAGYALVASSAMALLGAAPYSAVFWLAHVLDIGGVFLAVIAALFVYRRAESAAEVLAPVLAVEPIAALEVGMHPEVHRFLKRLAAKDQPTRDHVVRTAELAIQVAELMRLPAETQRTAGLTGVLHDIGKLRIPDAILNKEGPLSDDEWLVMRSHAAAGGTMLEASGVLADLAAPVRAHHERMDGAGYPDGLRGDAIPLAARIVSVCDAFDAMAYARRYRSAMPLDEVMSILRSHAGTQWDPLVVQAVITIVSRRVDWEPQLLTSDANDRCDCLAEIGVAAFGADSALTLDVAEAERASTSADTFTRSAGPISVR